MEKSILGKFGLDFSFPKWTEPASLNPAELLRKNQKARKQLFPIRTERPARQREHIKTPHGAAEHRKPPELSISCVRRLFNKSAMRVHLNQTAHHKPPQNSPQRIRSAQAGTDQGGTANLQECRKNARTKRKPAQMLDILTCLQLAGKQAAPPAQNPPEKKKKPLDKSERLCYTCIKW